LLGLYRTRRNVESLVVGNKSVSGSIRTRQRLFAHGQLWFLGTLVPTIGLVQVGEQAMADRYVYLPLIGIFIALVWTVWDLAKERNIPKTWRAVPAISILAVLGIVTHRPVEGWHDGETLWNLSSEYRKSSCPLESRRGVLRTFHHCT
jgi:protein O-mannosyl-transferase